MLKLIFKNNKYLIAVIVLAIALRFTNLSNPSNYIFDEVYHAFTAREYLNGHKDAWEWWTTPPEGVAYEWTHPGVAKYFMVVGMAIFGENSLGWRIGSALAGVISIYGFYLLVLNVTKNKELSVIATFLLSIEGLNISQSRIAMNDIYMLCFYIWSLYSATKSRWKTSAVLYALALGSKWSALYGILPLAYIYFNSIKSKLTFYVIMRQLFESLRLLLIILCVYVLTFAPFILVGHSWAEWWELHRQMWYYHTHLVATHGYQSTPIQWLFDVRPVWYHVKYLPSSISNIYAIANPVILWLGLLAILMQLKKLLTYKYFLFFFVYLVFTFPWVFSPRIMFFYHYMPSASFLTVLLASWLVEFEKKYIILVMILAVLGLVVIAPMLYAIPLSQHYWDILFGMIPSWK